MKKHMSTYELTYFIFFMFFIMIMFTSNVLIYIYSKYLILFVAQQNLEFLNMIFVTVMTKNSIIESMLYKYKEK